MIRRVEIENFRCIRKATIDFAPLTVLVGPNASGKSSVLKALDPAQDWPAADLWRHGEVTASAQVTLANNQVVVREAVRCNTWGGETYRLLRLDLKQLRAENQLSSASRLAGDGSNLANTFATMTRAKQAAVARQLCELTSVFYDVDTAPTQNGFHAFRFQDRWDTNVWYASDEVSDGTMLLLAYLVVQHEDRPNHVIGVEEPDRGLHPYLLGELIGLMRRMSTGAHGGAPIQFILATHSAELLDHVKPEEVRFLTRDAATGALEVESIDTTQPDWPNTLREYRASLGSVWLSGGVGGVPGA